MTAFDRDTCELTSEELNSVIGGAPSCAQFDVLGIHFNFEWDNVKVTWWDGRESWRGWGR